MKSEAGKKLGRDYPFQITGLENFELRVLSLGMGPYGIKRFSQKIANTKGIINKK